MLHSVRAACCLSILIERGFALTLLVFICSPRGKGALSLGGTSQQELEYLSAKPVTPTPQKPQQVFVSRFTVGVVAREDIWGELVSPPKTMPRLN